MVLYLYIPYRYYLDFLGTWWLASVSLRKRVEDTAMGVFVVCLAVLVLLYLLSSM